MKVLIVNKLYHPFKVGGAEVSVQNLAESFSLKGHDVHVLTLGTKSEDVEFNGVKIHRLKIRNIYWPYSGKKDVLSKAVWHLLDIYNPLVKRQVKSIIKKIQPDVLHTNNLAGFSVSVWAAASELSVPIVHTSRDYYLLHPDSSLFKNGRNQKPSFWVSLIFGLVKKRLSRKVDTYIGVSDYIREAHSAYGYFNGSKCRTIYNSITLPDDRVARPPDSVIVIGFIGRIDKAKGLETLLDACNELEFNHAVVVAGSGDESYLTEIQYKYQNQNISWLGHVEPSLFYNMINVLVVPSLWNEPLGRVVIEANSYGIPVIGSDRGGIPEIIKPNKTGFIFKAGNITSLQEQLYALRDMDESVMSRNCVDYSKSFTNDIISTHYLDVLKDAITASN